MFPIISYGFHMISYDFCVFVCCVFLVWFCAKISPTSYVRFDGTPPELSAAPGYIEFCAAQKLYQGDPNQKLRDFLVFSCFFNVFYGIFGVYIFPKWLKKVPGHIPILFSWFWELRKSWLFLDLLLVISGPVDPVFMVFLIPNYFKQY